MLDGLDLTDPRMGLEIGDIHNDAILGPAQKTLMPTKAAFLSAYEEHQLEQIAKNYRLTPATLAYQLENRNLADTDPLKWYPAAFLMHISLRIAIAIAKGNGRIIISAPPRHGKSRLSTIHAPLWVLENFASKNVVTTTYGADLSEDFGRTIRDFIYKNPDILDVRVRQDASKVSKFLTSKDGALTSIGIGGPITGRGADVLLVDDYIKQIKEALSPTYRDYVYDWFTTTAMTRLEPNASVIIIATRWHHDDLIGRIIKNFGTTDTGGDWEYIKYHSIARENDVLGRAPGEALFPQRYSVKTLQERKKLLGSMYFDAIFDQEPHENDGDLTDKSWLIKVKAPDIPPGRMRFVRVWDFAGTESAKSDYTAGGLLAANDATEHVYLLNMVRKQITAAKVEKLVKKTAEADGPEVDIVICQETGSAGKAVVDYYQRNVLSEYRVKGHYWNTGKVIVAQPWLAACEDGEFHILEAPWNQDFEDEFEHFPSEGAGYHDDQMDVCSNGFIFLYGKKRLKATWGKSAKQKLVIPADPKAAAKLLADNASLYENSPHKLLKQGKSWSFGTVSKATFGRKSRIIRP